MDLYDRARSIRDAQDILKECASNISGVSLQEMLEVKMKLLSVFMYLHLSYVKLLDGGTYELV